MKQFIFMVMFISILTSSELNSQNIVLGSFTKKENASKFLQNNKSKLESILAKHLDSSGLSIGKINEYFVVLASGGNEPEKTKNALKDIKNIVPSAFLSQKKFESLEPKKSEGVVEEKVVEKKVVDEVSESKSDDNKSKTLEESLKSGYIIDKDKKQDKNESVEVADESGADFYSLKQMINEVIANDPEIQERLHQYKSTIEELKMAKSGFLPKLDLSGRYGKKQTKVSGVKSKYTSGDVSLQLTQNLFNGFATLGAVYRDDARARAAYKKFVEVAQSKVFSAVEAYINVIEYKEVLSIAKDNVKVHEETLVRIKRRFDEGFSTLSEVERVEGRLALSRSNFIAETNNLYDAKIKFYKALGRWLGDAKLKKPEFSYTLPETLEEATSIALIDNPSIQVANADINATRGSLKFASKGFFPTVDLELKGAKYKNRKGADTPDETELSGMVVVNYNLFNGGQDMANRQKYLSLLNYEYAHRNKLKRDLLESLGLSWSAYKLLSEQRKFQIDYQNLTQKSKESYSKEFQLGRRTLIDLLDVQDEVNNIRIKVIHNEYDLLFAKYRVADAMGKMFEMFDYEHDKTYVKDKNQNNDIDSDGDGVIDVYDQCDNSQGEVNEYGCKKLHTIAVDKIDFDTTIKIDKSNDVDISDVKKLWNVN